MLPFHVHVHTYSSERVGARTKQVLCEQCGAKYEYRCIRRVVGESNSEFGVGAEGAQRQADERGHRLLELRLDQGIDPVPCPSCGWVQQAMVDALNRHRHRWMIGVSIAAIGLTVIAALTLLGKYKENPQSPEAQRAARFVTTALPVALAGAGLPLVVRRALRLNPNAGHAAVRGRELPGAPRAFPAGVLGSQPMVVSHPPHLSSNGWVTVQLAGLQHPSICCDCGAATSAARKFSLGSRRTQITVRICDECQQRYQRRRTWTVALATIAGAATMMGITFHLVTFDADGLRACIGAGMFGALVAGPTAWLVHYLFLRPIRARAYSPLFDTVSLKFRNPAYAPALAGVKA